MYVHTRGFVGRHGQSFSSFRQFCEQPLAALADTRSQARTDFFIRCSSSAFVATHPSKASILTSSFSPPPCLSSPPIALFHLPFLFCSTRNMIVALLGCRRRRRRKGRPAEVENRRVGVFHAVGPSHGLVLHEQDAAAGGGCQGRRRGGSVVNHRRKQR